LHVAGHEMVVLERDREAVRGGSCEARRLHELREGRGSCLEGAEHDRRLVEHADSAAVLLRGLVHAPILPSYWVRRKCGAPLARRAPLSSRHASPQRAQGRIVMAGTLAEKVWADHVVRRGENGEPDLLYIDLQLLHEVTSPQAFDGLRQEGRTPRRIDQTIATEDHNTPTIDIDKPIADITSRTQIETLRRNAEEFGVRIHSLGDKDQGIVHVVGPQLGLTMPGITVVCGDSHTSTHGAFGALAFGIGTSEVEH